MVNDWPAIDKTHRPGDPNVDVCLEYPDDNCSEMETNLPAILPDPSGMSGGGVCDQRFETGSLWTPRDCKLFAIQSSWSESRRYLRATQIRHGVDLIRADFPDLRRFFRKWNP